MIVDILSAQYRRDPYPIFKSLRDEKMLCRAEPFGYWLIPNYADVQHILRNSTVFCSSGISEEPDDANPEFFLHSRGLVGFDKPDHTRVRRLVSKAFTPLTIRKLKLQIRQICKSLIGSIILHNTVDIVADFCVPLPILVLAELLGINTEMRSEFAHWANVLLTWQKQGKTPEILSSARQMYDYFNALINDRKRSPKNDFISNLVLACVNENTITSSELLGIMRLLLVAGSETTTNLIANGIAVLCSRPHEVETMRHNQKLLHNFIEEILRYDSPVLSLIRRANDDVKIAQTNIKKGEIVLPLLASANYDKTKFINPDRFDMNRDSRSHLSFGAGIHYCLGSQLARLQAQIAFEELFLTFKRFEMTQVSEYQDSFFFRGVRNLSLRVKL